MEMVWKGCFLVSVLLQTRVVCGLPKQLVRQGNDNNEDNDTNYAYHNLNEQHYKEPAIQTSNSFGDVADIHGRTDYIPETGLQENDKLVPRISLDSIVRNYIRDNKKIHGNMAKSETVAKRVYDKLTKGQLNRVKRDQDIGDVESNITDVINGVCLTNECVEVFKQFMEWRKENGYPAYTGVTSIG